MQNAVHYENLNPLSFLQRSAFAYPDKTAVVYNDQSFTYRQLDERVKRPAGGLREAGIGKGDRVAFLVPNLPPMLEGHFGPLYLGAVLVAINTRRLWFSISAFVYAGWRRWRLHGSLCKITEGVLADVQTA